MDQFDDVSKIKRPMNAFMVWSQIRRAEIANSDSKIHNSEISKELGAEWRQMSAEDKAPFVQKAKDLRDELLRRHPDYVYRPKRKSRPRRTPYTARLPGIPTSHQQRQQQQQQEQQLQQQQQYQALLELQHRQRQFMLPFGPQLQDQYILSIINAFRSQLLAHSSNSTATEKPESSKEEAVHRPDATLAVPSALIGTQTPAIADVHQQRAYVPAPVNQLVVQNPQINPELMVQYLQTLGNLNVG